MVHNNSHHGDPFIFSILDSIFHLSQIDPEWIQPDFSFDRDLELSPEQVLAIGRHALKKLDIKTPDSQTAHLSQARSPRELLILVKKIAEESMMTNAA